MPSAKRFPRVDQLLASLGYGTRRDIDIWIKQGRVKAAGIDKLRSELRLDPALISIDEQPLDHPHELLIIMHKPLGYVCSHAETEGSTVYDLLPPLWMRRTPQIESIGRLDRDTSGLLLLTDQHELVHQLTSPRNHVAKVYEATVEATITQKMIDIFASGTLLLHGETKPCLPAKLEAGIDNTARVTLNEGRYHQVRRMLGAVGAPVLTLHRSRFGPLDLTGLDEGEFRAISIPQNWVTPEGEI